MKFTVEIKNNLVSSVGTKLGNPNNPEEAIQAYLQAIIDNIVNEVIEADAEIVLLKEQLLQKIEEKRISAKNK